jgi:GxxExxY protein
MSMNSPLGASVDNLAKEVINAAIYVHRELGPGLLESVYATCLGSELERRQIRTRSEVAVPVRFNGLQLEAGFRADLIVEDLIVLELKSVEKILPVHQAQLITYLKLTNLDLGYLLNFNTALLKNGIVRLLHPRHLKSIPLPTFSDHFSASPQ